MAAWGPDRHIFSNAITAFMFCATGPLAILITTGQAGGLREQDMASWIFGGYGMAGVITLWICHRYKRPIVIAWTIPAALLLPSALNHLSFQEVIGAYWVTGIAVTLLGWSGLVTRVMRSIPMPIVMGMVAGVFLPLVLKVVTAFTDNALIAGITLVIFLLFSRVTALGRTVPPVLAALITGSILSVAVGAVKPMAAGGSIIIHPTVYTPVFSIQAMLELVVPLMVTMLGIQNAQGIAILKQGGHEPPIQAVTNASGLGSLLMAITGSVPVSLTGPVSGILVSSGDPRRQWTGAFMVGLGLIAIAAVAPLATRVALALPMSLIGMVGGLAMLRVLQTTFQTAFKGECPLGALVAFLVSVANVPIFNIGAPFWGLVFAVAASWLLERDGLRRLANAAAERKD